MTYSTSSAQNPFSLESNAVDYIFYYKFLSPFMCLFNRVKNKSFWCRPINGLGLIVTYREQQPKIIRSRLFRYCER